MILDLVETGKSAVHIQRIKLCERNAISKQCLLKRIDWVFAQGTAAREFFDIPVVGPALRNIVFQQVRAGCKDVAINRYAEEVVKDGFRHDIRHLFFGDACRFQQH
ncbi:hypothetical protein D3C81_2109940 [compost metagenome]